MPDLEANRLTDDDRRAIRSRIAETVTSWRRTAPNWHVVSGDVWALERIAHNAIGCSAYDLRAAELDEIAGMVRDAIAGQAVSS
ncbi:MAG TPA: hypothetical protein VF244_02790 [Acidimicrobiales bacterium]